MSDALSFFRREHKRRSTGASKTNRLRHAFASLLSPQSFVLSPFSLSTQHSALSTLFLITRYSFLITLLFLLLSASAAQAQTQPEPTPQPLYALPNANFSRAYASNTMALLPGDGRTVVAANMLNNTATIFIPSQNAVLAEIRVGQDPRSVAVTPDSARAVVANRVDSTLSVIDIRAQRVIATIPLGGAWAYGVVTNETGMAYVSLMGSDEIAVVDLNAGVETARIPVPDMPAGLVLWGEFLYVTHFWSGQISLVYLPQERVVQTVSTGEDTGVFQAIEPDVTRGLAYLPQTRLNARNASLTYDTTAFPIVNVIDLRDLSTRHSSRIALDTADRPVNMPFAAALDRFNQRLYVANAGSNDVSIIDLTTGLARAHIPVGANPRGILLNRDNSLLFVHSVLDGTVTTIQTSNQQVVDVLPITNLTIPANLLLGSQTFHNADDPRLTTDGWLSCATCHFDGLSDGRVWQGFPDGPRNTPLLYALPETVPYTWSGAWDELEDVELKIRWLLAGEGLLEGTPNPPLGSPHGGLSPDLDVLTAYLLSLRPPAAAPPQDQALAQRGAEVFLELNCASCHVGSAGTNLEAYDVGTGSSGLERHGAALDTPSLRWLWLSAPYFHDGSAATLRQVFELPGTHQLIYDVPAEDVDALVAYLLTLPTVP
jgi:YVTN family beta-propeller protein